MSITTTTTLPAAVQQNLSLKMLAVPTPYMIHKLAASSDVLDANSGTVRRRIRYNPLSTFTAPLGNSGIHPPAQQLTNVMLDAEMDFYGTYVYINEQVTLQNNDPVLNNGALRLGVALRQTEDELTMRMLRSSASRINCVGGTSGDNPTELSRSDVDGVIRSLVNANGHTISDMIEAEDKFGTAPTRDSYVVMANSDLIGDLERVTGFIAKAQYPNQDKTLRPEWGTISNSRWFLSSIGSKRANASMNGLTVYDCFFAAMEGYSCIEQNGYSAKYIYRPPIYDGPLALNASIGCKFAEVPTLDNDAWVINLCTTLSL